LCELLMMMMMMLLELLELLEQLERLELTLRELLLLREPSDAADDSRVLG